GFQTQAGSPWNYLRSTSPTCPKTGAASAPTSNSLATRSRSTRSRPPRKRLLTRSSHPCRAACRTSTRTAHERLRRHRAGSSEFLRRNRTANALHGERGDGLRASADLLVPDPPADDADRLF